MHTRHRWIAFALAAFCAAAPACAEDALELLRGCEPERAAAVNPEPETAARFTDSFDGVPLGVAVREIARRGDANVIFSPAVAVDDPVTLSFSGVPWRAALESILKAHGCAVLDDADGSILRIATLGEAAGQFETRSRPLRYVRPEGARFQSPEPGGTIVSALESVKSAGGSVAHEARTNTLILRDTPARIREMLRIVDEIDVPPRQVLIETRMITVENDPASGAMSGEDLDALMRTARFDDRINLVQAPRILALDNEEVSVFVGNVRGYALPRGTADGGYSFEEKEILVGVRIRVIPQVCAGTDQVILEVIPEQTDSPEFTAVAAGGGTVRIPSGMRVKTARTKMMLRSGETGVISGLLRDETVNGLRAVPGLSKIPVVGRLFRHGIKQTVKRNTVFLVTPTIIPPDHGEEFDRDVEELRESLASSLM